MKTKQMNRSKGAVLTAVTIFCLLLGFIPFFSAVWYRWYCGDVGFDSVFFTMGAGAKGVDLSAAKIYAVRALLPALGCSAVAAVILLIQPKRGWTVKFRNRMVQLFPFQRVTAAMIAAAITISLIGAGTVISGMDKFLGGRMVKGNFYEEHYVNPDEVDIVFPQQKRNLVYIVLESLENTFMSQQAGGALRHDLMPELVALQQENVSFSHTDGLGGFYNTVGTTWSVGSMVSITSGIHLQVGKGNTKGQHYEQFLPGATTIMDILHKQGYNQLYLTGCDAKYGGLHQYVSQHGVDEVFDYYTAKQQGLIPEDYFQWWGYEDKKLMEYAKTELTRLSQQEQPFALYIATMDTHFTDGYFCEDCESQYDEQYDNVISCFDKRMSEFMQWMQQQPFMENTTVVLVGDHLTMDNLYAHRNVSEDYVRTAYNCIVNSAVQTDNTKNRLYASFDLFPTMLAAMGCEIPGNRLGLGTNLFSEEKTLLERYGSLEALNDHLRQYSQYYVDHFGGIS